MAIYLGTQGWSYKDWVGSFYPAGAKASEYLPLYSATFNVVELDTTFYGTPAAGKVDAWGATTPENFQFTAKVPRAITHDRHLVDAQAEMTEFVESITRLGSKLGAILIQLPPDFTSAERPALEAFFKQLPAGIRFAAEFRHRSWLREETYDLLQAHEIAWTIIDLHYMPATIRITAPFTYVRWLGDHRKIMRMNETQIDRGAELQRWAEELELVAQRVERVYGFVNNHYSGHSPADVRTLRRLLGLPDAAPPPAQQGMLL